MSAAEDELSAAPAVEPRLAASLILFDRTSDPPKVLLGRRHDNHVFMPGLFVFPGGRCEPEDSKMMAKGTLAADAALKLQTALQGTPMATPDALGLTAIRETFEETGLLLGEAATPSIAAPAGTSWARFVAAGVIPDLEKLYYIARAVTPPGLPRRFDTHFFAADAAHIAHRIDGSVHADAELTELRWVTFSDVAKLDIIPITHVIVMELAERLKAGLGHDLPVPYFHTRDDRWIRALI